MDNDELFESTASTIELMDTVEFEELLRRIAKHTLTIAQDEPVDPAWVLVSGHLYQAAEACKKRRGN